MRIGVLALQGDVAEHAAVLRASHAGRPVVVRERSLLAATFHPEILGQTTVHRYFLRVVEQAA